MRADYTHHRSGRHSDTRGHRVLIQSRERVPLGTLVIYALPTASFGFMGGLISMYLLKFSTDVLLIAPAVMGLWFGLSRIWDAVSDPLVGYWSDRTKTRLGRRRPWMIAAVLPLGLLFVALWSPPVTLTGNLLAVWTGGAIILFYTAQTALGIPHLALGAELTLDYHDRSRVFGARMILEFTGVILAASSLVLLERASDQRTIATELAIAGAVLTMGLVLLTATRIRERPEYQGRGATGSYGAFRDVLRNPHARLLVVVFLLDQLGFSALITLLPYMSQYILQETGMTGIFVGASIVSALVAYPIWFPLARRYGKRNPWIVATVIKAGAFGCMFFLQPGNWELIIALIVVIGAVQGAGNILGPSIKADVVDYDEYQTGERKEGSYFAIWNVATKAAAGVAIALTGFVLSAAGFRPNVEQSETTLLSMRLLFSAFPCLLNLTTALLLVRFSLNEREHARIRAALDARSGVSQGAGDHG